MLYIANYPTGGTGGGNGSINFSAGTTSNSLSNIVFSNSNGMFFGLNGSTITASASTVPAGSLYFGSSNGVTFGTSVVGATTTVTASINGGAGGAAIKGSGTYTQNSGTVEFANSNGITFGLSNNGTMTASHNGITQQSTQPVAVSGANGSFTFSTLSLANSNGVSFSTGTQGVYATVATNYQSQGAYLTTAMASNRGSDFLGTNTALTANGVSMTANSSGLSLNFPAFLTTAMQSQSSSVFAKTGFTSTTTAGTAVVATHDTNGLSMGIPVYLTTAMQSNAATISNINVSGGTTSSNLSAINFVNSNGVSWSLDTGSKVYATVKTDYLTTAMQSGSQSQLWIMGNSSASVGGTNISGTMYSNGLSLSAAAPGAGGGVAVSAGGSNFTSGTVTFGNTNGASFITTNGSVALSFSTAPAGSLFFGSTNGVTFGTSTAGASTTVTASVNAGAGAAFKGSGTYTQNSGTIEFANSNGITFGLSNNGTMTASHNGITQQSTQPVAVSGSNGSFTYATLTLGSSNGMHFYSTNGSVVGSYTVPSTAGLLSAFNISGGTTSSNETNLKFADSNGVSFGLNGSVITATVATNYQSQGAYLTTARASNDAIGLNTALTANGVSWTVNSSGLSLNVPAFLTTAMQSNAATISNINVSGGTTSSNLSALNFVNSNGVSWSLDTASKIYATVATNYQSQGAYLTTAMQSGSQSQLWIMGNSSGTVGGTNISGTVYSNGMSLSVAAPGGGNTLTVSAANGTFQSNAITFANSNGVSFSTGTQGVYATVATNYQSQGAYLTTARASNDAVGLNTALTAGPLAWTVNSNGISLNASSAAGTTSGFGGNLISGSMTHNTAGLNLSLNHPAWLTTAMASNAATISNINVSGGTTSSNLSALNFVNSNGVSWILDTASKIYATVATNYQSQGAYLTTARASTDAIGLNTAQSNVTWTVNSSGLSLDARGYAGTASTFNGTNVSGSITLNSAGLRLDLSAANAAAGNVTFSAGTTSSGLAAVTFSNSNGVSFGLGTGANAGVITASVNAGGGGIAISASNSAFTSGTVSLNQSGALTIGTGAQAINFSVPATSSIVGTNGISVSSNGSTISISQLYPYVSRFIFPNNNAMTAISAFGNGTASIQYINLNGFLTGTRLDCLVGWSAGSTTNNSTMNVALSVWGAIYTRNGDTLNSVSSGSTQTTYTYASNNSGWSSINGAIRPVSVPINFNMTPGEYYVMMDFSTTVSSAGGATTNLGQTISAYGPAGIQTASNFAEFGAVTATSKNVYGGMGLYSAALGSVPPAISLSAINQTGANLSRANINLVFRNY